MILALRSFISSRRWHRLLLFFGIFCLFFLWSLYNLDPDFGWHLRSGQYFIEHGIPQTDIYTYTAQDFHWVNHEWLSDIIVATIFSIGSYLLLAFVYASMWTTIVAIMGRGVHAAILISATIAILPFSGIRALTWSALGIALLTLLLRQKNKRWRLLIPLLFLLWANIHGSFLIGIAYGAWTVCKERSWRLLLIGMVSIGVTFINPYGLEVYTEIFRTMLDGNLHAVIAEWARFSFPISAILYLFVWIALTVYTNKHQWRRYIRFDSLLFIMSISSVRMTPLFVLASLPEMNRMIKEVKKGLPHKDRALQKRMGVIAATCLIVASFLLPIAELFLKRSEGIVYPIAAVEVLTKTPCKGNIFNSYNFGGYLIWKLPSHKVYIDGRMPSWEYQDGMYMKDYLRIRSDAAYRDQQFTRFNIDCVLVENAEAIMIKELSEKGWIKRVNDGYSTLLIAPETN